MSSYSDAPEVIPTGGRKNKRKTQNGVSRTTNGASNESVLDASPVEEKVYSVLDQVAQLNELGARYDYPLPQVPQVIVCGSQSAGKSSVLEAITEIPFPSNLDLCTRYPTRVTIRRAEDSGAVFRIIPSNSEGIERQGGIRGFKKSFSWQEWEIHKQTIMQDVVREADELIFKGTPVGDRGWAKDTLDITVSSPTKRPLQVLDLPGLIETNPKNKAFIKMVKNMVEDEMEKEHCLILAVIEGHGDVNTHKILDLCAEHDKTGKRTIAVITKPDVEIGIQKAPSWIKLIHGGSSSSGYKNMWHVLRNRTNDERSRGTSSEDRDLKETDFLNKGAWKDLEPEFKGIEALRYRLRGLIFDIATEVFPGIRKSMQRTLADRKKELQEISGHIYDDKVLLNVFEDAVSLLCDMARDHARGIYEHNITHFPATHPIHLRARVVEENWIFHDDIIHEGHAWERKGRQPIDPDADLLSIPGIGTDRAGGDHMKAIVNKMRRKKAVDRLEPDKEQNEALELLYWKPGRELPGNYDSQRINDLFWRLSKRWLEMTKNHIDSVYDHLISYFEEATPLAFQASEIEPRGFPNSKLIAERFVAQFIIPGLEKRKIAAQNELLELELDRQEASQNYNKEFMKQNRQQRNMRAKARDMMAISANEVAVDEITDSSWAKSKGHHNQNSVIEETGLDLLESTRIHYLIMRATFITNVNMQVVERHFMRDLKNAISKVGVGEDDTEVSWQGNVEVIKELVAASEDTEQQRKDISKEILFLEKTLTVLNVTPGLIANGFK